MNILIVEDEMVVAADIQGFLEDYGFKESVIAINYTEAVRALETTPVHLAILDIHLGGYKTGIDVAQYISSKMPVPFIFLTAYEDMPTISAALATKPHAYLQKPFGNAALYAAIQLALMNYKKEQDSSAEADDSLIIRDAFFVKEKSGYIRVAVQEVQYIRSDGNYMELHTARRKYLIRIPQKALLAQLPATFIKVNKSYIVNSAVVTAIGAETVSVGDVVLPLADGYKAPLLEQLKTFS